LVAASCAAPRIDTSSDEKLAASTKRVRESLPADERAEFDQAIMVVAMSKLPVEGGLLGMAALANASPETMKATFLAPLNGKTAKEVLAEAKRITDARKAKEREQAVKEIADLQALRVSAERATVELKKFEVQKSRFEQRKAMFGNEPLIQLAVKNGTSSPISRAYFRGTIASVGRAVPWLKEEFNYDIRGGLEPGESATWNLAPNRFSAWGTTEPPRDAILTVDVLRLDGADGKPLFDATAFDADKASRLAALTKEYGQATP
jgi:hypothetical protein